MAYRNLIKIFATTGSAPMAEGIFNQLIKRLFPETQNPQCLTMGEAAVQWFPNQNIQVQTDHIRDHLAIVVHTQFPDVSKGIIELFALLDAIFGAQAAEILLLFSYMPYSRSDRKDQPRISTMGVRLPYLLTHGFEGTKRFLLLDPHDSHIKHFFSPVADEISAIYLLAAKAQEIFFSGRAEETGCVVFPDEGAARRYRVVSALLKCPSAYIDKARDPETGNIKTRGIIGAVKGKVCLLVDDEVATGTTAMKDAQALLDAGAKAVYMIFPHAVLMDSVLTREEVTQKLNSSPISGFITTDSIPFPATSASRFTIVSVAPFLAEAIACNLNGGSLSDLHRLSSVGRYMPRAE